MQELSHLRDHNQERRLINRRLLVAGLLMGCAVVVLGLRLVALQVHGHEHFVTLSDRNRIRLQPLPPTRGLIFDRRGLLLADNLPSYRLEIIPEQVDDLDGTLQALASLLELTEEDLSRFHRARRRQPHHEGVPLRLRLSEEELGRVAVNLHRLPGVHVQADLTRFYPLGALGAHALGYVGRISERDLQSIDTVQYRGTTHIGKIGVERAFEDLLHGKVGYQQVETNARGRTLRVLDRSEPVPGMNIYLTLDAELQQAAEQALGEQHGAIVALDPRSGDVLAMVSKPTFDPNMFVRGVDAKTLHALNSASARPLFNRALRGRYPPGSTVKPLVGLAGLEAGVVSKDTGVYCPGFYQLPNNSRKYRDWKKWGHGRTNLDLAIVQSCDVYYYALGRELGIDRMHDFLARFGFGRITGLDIGGEHPGLLPSSTWKRGAYNEPWYTGETLIAAIGQGFMLTTPLQLAHSTAVLANRGAAFRPHLLGSVENPDSGLREKAAVSALPPVELRAAGHWQQIILAMTRVVHSPRGTAFRVGQDAPYRFAGKTGTAQVFSLAEDEEYDAATLDKKLHDHALFVAFAPVDTPEIVVAVVVEHGGGGSSVAAPVARQVLDSYLGPQPETARLARSASDEP